MFESPMDLHYSQTMGKQGLRIWAFESPMDLHYSQTHCALYLSNSLFESPMDLHYSQTLCTFGNKVIGLNPLWIYTTLKRSFVSRRESQV